MKLAAIGDETGTCGKITVAPITTAKERRQLKENGGGGVNPTFLNFWCSSNMTYFLKFPFLSGGGGGSNQLRNSRRKKTQLISYRSHQPPSLQLETVNNCLTQDLSSKPAKPSGGSKLQLCARICAPRRKLATIGHSYTRNLLKGVNVSCSSLNSLQREDGPLPLKSANC